MERKGADEIVSPKSPDIDYKPTLYEENKVTSENIRGNCLENENEDIYETTEEIKHSNCLEKISTNITDQDELLEPVTPTKEDKDTNIQKVLIDIKFKNKKTYFAFHGEFIEIIKKYYKDKLDDLDVSDDALSNRICISEKLVKKSESFLIDTTPNLGKTSTESTPKYTSFSKTILSNIKDEEVEKGITVNKCFNCDKDSHTLRNCPEPRNLHKIRKARNEFSRKETRYHDENDDLLNITPGVLSSDLQAALGITENQLPLHVYKMRKFGYPPAWLEEAKIYYSNIEANDTLDKMEFEREQSIDNFKYDVQKIYEFPGFNVIPPFVPFVDKHRLLNLPPMLPCHSKETFILSLGDFVTNGYKRRKINNRVCTQGDDSLANVEDIEMEIENYDIEKNNLNLITNETPQSPVEDGELSNSSNHSLLNVEELQKERNKLLSELSDMNVSDVKTNSEDNEETNNSRIDNEQHGEVETTIFGCPILPSFSSFCTLPSGEKFQQGVCDVIAFENLAESTGKYEKMKGLLKKVRVLVKEHQKD